MDNEPKDQSNSDSPRTADLALKAKLPDWLQPVCEEHNPAILAFVMNAGVASEALAVVATLAQKNKSRHGMAAVEQLARMLQDLSALYAAERGWGQEMLAEADAAILAAFSTKAPRVQLLH